MVDVADVAVEAVATVEAVTADAEVVEIDPPLQVSVCQEPIGIFFCPAYIYIHDSLME